MESIKSQETRKDGREVSIRERVRTAVDIPESEMWKPRTDGPVNIASIVIATPNI